MNIFGVGEIELVLIVLIALIVAGPKRMIQWMYVLGRWVAQLRRMWSEAVGLIQNEIDESGLDIQVPKDLPTRGSLRQMTVKALKPLSDPVKEAVDEVRTVGTEIENTVKQTRKTVSSVRDEVRAAGGQLTAPPAKAASRSSTNGQRETQPDQDAADSPFGTWSSGKE